MENYDYRCPWCNYIYDDSPVGYDGEYGYQYSETTTVNCVQCSKVIRVEAVTTTTYTATKVE